MKTPSKPITVSAAQVPPYCYRLPGMSPDEAAAVAVRELRITQPADALALLWQMRREAQAAQTTGAEYFPVTHAPKTQPRSTVKAAGLFERSEQQ